MLPPKILSSNNPKDLFTRYKIYYIVMHLEGIRPCETLEEAMFYVDMYKDNDKVKNLYIWDSEKEEIIWRNEEWKSTKEDKAIIEELRKYDKKVKELINIIIDGQDVRESGVRF